jgi:mono/diheme cytochrome c family protein
MTELTRCGLIAFLGLSVALIPATAQAKQAAAAKPGSGAGQAALVERGKYIVENVAMCELCHTPRDQHGNPERGNWLKGGPVPLHPAYSAPDWPLMEPKIGGGPPGTDAEFIRLMTTGISRTGSPPRAPMPPFRFTRADAEAVLAYLKSLR